MAERCDADGSIKLTKRLEFGMIIKTDRISTVYYYVPSIDGYILEAELGRNEHNDILGIQKLYHKPPFGDNLHSQKLRISFTMNGKDYLFKAKVNRKKGKALHISVSTQPPELIQSWVYGVFKTKY